MTSPADKMEADPEGGERETVMSEEAQEIVKQLRDPLIKGPDGFEWAPGHIMLKAADLIERLTAPVPGGEVEEIKRMLTENLRLVSNGDGEICECGEMVTYTWRITDRSIESFARAILNLGYRKLSAPGVDRVAAAVEELHAALRAAAAAI